MLMSAMKMGTMALTICLMHAPLVVLVSVGLNVAGVPEGVVALAPAVYVLGSVAAVSSATAKGARRDRIIRRSRVY